MKSCIFSESQIRGKVPRDFENVRTEFGWVLPLDAEWCPIGQTPLGKCDLGIVIIPKNNPNVDITKLQKWCGKIICNKRDQIGISRLYY